jgi:ATP-binding cassette subfamily F protein uup
VAFLLSCQDLTKSFGARPLFDGLTLGFEEGERVGLIGPNGSGKSTLLRLLTGEERPDRGVVSARRGLRMGYVPQEEALPAGESVQAVLDSALHDSPLDDHERALRVEETLARLAFARPEQAVETLSGGWRKRLAIARELIREPELLLLDEPTNHLDLEGILWLERTLSAAPFAVAVVSHDRYFLQNVASRIVELNPAYPEGYISVNGAYDDYLARREETLQAQLHREQALASRARREVAWLRASAPARSTKANARIRQAGELLGELGDVRRRNAMGKVAGIDFDATGRRTKEMILAKGIEKRMGDRPLFSGLDLLLSPGMKLGLIGPNGSGKSTLLKVLTGELEPDRGAIRRAEGLRVVLFDQNRAQLPRGIPLREALGPSGDTVVYQGRGMHVAAWAKRFLFDPAQLEMSVDYLSGGEQARVLIARLMLQPADLLILDEPTNDLDIDTLEVLEESLLEFPGALVLVTHDRFMLDRVSTEVLALDGKGRARLLADYSQWERLQEEAARLPAARPAPLPTKKAPPANRLSTSEQRELNKMEERIESAEAKVCELEQLLADPGVASDHVRLQECWRELEAAKERVAGLYARWEELETKRGAA